MKVCLDLVDKTYRDLEKIAYIKGTSVELVVLEAINWYLRVARDIDDHYRLKYERVVEETRKLLEEGLKRGLIKSRGALESKRVAAIASSLGKLVTLLVDAYGHIPRELHLESLGESDLSRLRSSLSKLVPGAPERGLDPVTYIRNRVREVESVAAALGIEVIAEGGNVKALRFNNVNLLSMYYGYGTRFLKRKLRGS